MDALLVSAALVAYNNVLNRWPWFNGTPFVPVNLAAAAFVLGLALGPLDLEAGRIGLDVSFGGLALGILIGCALAVPLFVIGGRTTTAHLIADRRSAGLAGRRLAYQTLVRVPLGTAALEEIAFRGVLFTLILPAGTLNAAVASSVAFGLWHITPSLNMLAANRPGAPLGAKALVVGGTVALTTLAGLGFVLLKVETGDLGAPFALHASLNSLATLAACRAARRSSQLGADVDNAGEGLQPVDEVLGRHAGGQLD